VLKTLIDAGAALRIQPEHAGLPLIKSAAQKLGVALSGNPAKGSGDAPSSIYVFDGSGLSSPAQIRELYDFMQPVLAGVPSNGRILVLSRAPSEAGDASHVASATALRGFIRALGKEVGKKGITANLLEVQTGAEDWLAGPLRFFLSEHAAFISGQVLPVGAGPREEPIALPGSLQGKVALVTGAARGIGASIADTLAREGATIIGMDHPSAEGGLAETMARINGVGLALDVTAKDAAARIAAEADKKFGGLDIVVHNAGVTRDKMLRNMAPHLCDMVLDINFGAILRINEGLLKDGLKDGARMVCISSIGGISGNAGRSS
jgi:3-oxoacyl-[acyl-carrier protein] reductase